MCLWSCVWSFLELFGAGYQIVLRLKPDAISTIEMWSCMWNLRVGLHMELLVEICGAKWTFVELGGTLFNSDSYQFVLCLKPDTIPMIKMWS